MFDVKFLLSEKIYLLEVDENGCHDVRPEFRLLKAPWKMLTCLRYNQKKF